MRNIPKALTETPKLRVTLPVKIHCLQFSAGNSVVTFDVLDNTTDDVHV